VRLSAIAPAGKPSPLEIIHVWFEAGSEHSHVEKIENPAVEHAYTVSMQGAKPTNYSIILACR
jgi:hypothetical protein